MKSKRKPRHLTAFVARIDNCPEHGPRVTEIATRYLGEITYEAPGSDAALSSSVGWSAAYGAGWGRVFGQREVN